MESLFLGPYQRIESILDTLNRTEWAIFRATNLEITLSYRQANVLMADLDFHQNRRDIPHR